MTAVTATVAASASPFAVAGAAPLAPIEDDTFERIRQHQETCNAHTQVCERLYEVELVVPRKRREAFSIADRGTDVGKNDDPRWTAIVSEYWATSDKIDQLAWSFVDRPPTTVAGLAALTAYVVETWDDGMQWPDCRHTIEAGVYKGYTEEDWAESMFGAISTALTKIAERQTAT
jgi:hypothetical protein